MKLHVFNDLHGFFLNLTVKRILENSAPNAHLFINLNSKTIYRDKRVTYLRRNINSYRKAVQALPEIESVNFYPLDFTAAWFLKQLRTRFPDIPVSWIFWSYEYYQRPEKNGLNYDAFSLAYYRKKNSFVSRLKQTGVGIIKKSINVPVYDKRLLEDAYQLVDHFHSFLPEDFQNVYKNTPNPSCAWHPFSFLSIEDITRNVETAARLTEKIMVGHAAIPSMNHAEILQRLSTLRIANPLFIPLEYGEKDYREEIMDMANRLFAGRVEFLVQRLEMHEYYRHLSDIGYAVFNFRWQEGLGNILFLAWNGTKIFLREESSVSRQFMKWGITVFSIEKDLSKASLSNRLSAQAAENNRRVLEDLFSEKKVKEYWSLLQ